MQFFDGQRQLGGMGNEVVVVGIIQKKTRPNGWSESPFIGRLRSRQDASQSGSFAKPAQPHSTRCRAL
jgi:hypothetical protein